MPGGKGPDSLGYMTPATAPDMQAAMRAMPQRVNRFRASIVCSSSHITGQARPEHKANTSSLFDADS